MMNKKDTKINRNDMLELTRRMTLSRNCFVRAAGAYIDDEGYIDNTFNVSFKNMRAWRYVQGICKKSVEYL